MRSINVFWIWIPICAGSGVSLQVPSISNALTTSNYYSSVACFASSLTTAEHATTSGTRLHENSRAFHTGSTKRPVRLDTLIPRLHDEAGLTS